MKIYTRVVMDWEGTIIEADYYEYVGPLALCDRALQGQAEQAGKTAAQTAGNYGAAGMGVEANLVPRLESMAVTPPGYDPAGLAMMETSAMESGAASTGAAQEAARLRAMRTGNAAGVGNLTAAAAGEGARATGGALQSILAKNAQLKAQQQQQANTGLQGILGEDIRGQVGNAGLVPEDVNAGVNAGKSGWFQNFMDYYKTAADAAAKMAGG